MRPARVQADEFIDDPSDSRDHRRCAQLCGPLGLDPEPASDARKPRQTAPQPKPPTAAQAAQIVDAAWAQDDDWGMLVWLAMTTGARRGELLALRWTDVDWDAQIVEIRRSFTMRSGRAIEKDTKTHQMRRIGLDPATMELLEDHRRRVQHRLTVFQMSLADDGFIFNRPAHQLRNDAHLRT